MRPQSLALKLTAWLALACHVIVASGLPLPLGGVVAPADRATASRIAGKDRSRPFPCMDKPCGCATAEQCFANCCCHTPAQRLAWAKAHAVEPAVLVALERRVAAEAAPAEACCSSRQDAPTCCASDDEPTLDLDGPDVCRDYRSCAAEPARTERAAAEESHDPTPRAVILRDALACGGIVAGWLACGVAVPPPPRVVAPAATDLPDAMLALYNEFAASFCADLSAPPPRAA